MDPAFWAEAPPVNGTLVAVAFFGGVTTPVPTGVVGTVAEVFTATVVGQPGQTTPADVAGTPWAEGVLVAGTGAVTVM